MRRTITANERVALKKVSAKIAADEFRHFRLADMKGEIAARSRRPMFNMEVTCEKTACGTAACIGGFVALEMGMSTEDAAAYVSANDYAFSPLYRLYFPYELDDWEKIRPMQAYQAISNFLQCGDPLWADVMTRPNHGAA